MMSAWLSAVREYFSRIELTAKLAPSCATMAPVENETVSSALPAPS